MIAPDILNAFPSFPDAEGGLSYRREVTGGILVDPVGEGLMPGGELVHDRDVVESHEGLACRLEERLQGVDFGKPGFPPVCVQCPVAASVVGRSDE